MSGFRAAHSVGQCSRQQRIRRYKLVLKGLASPWMPYRPLDQVDIEGKPHAQN